MKTVEQHKVVDLRKKDLGKEIWLENCSILFPKNFEGVRHISLKNMVMIKESILLWNLTDLVETFDDLQAAFKVLNTTLHTLQEKTISCDDFQDLMQLLEAKIGGKEVTDPSLDPILSKLVKRKHNLNDFPDIFPEELEILDLSGNGLYRLPDSVLNSRVHILSLSHNKFRNFPIREGQLKQLGELYLDHNQLGSNPVNLNRLPIIYLANLSSNNIRRIDPNIFYCESLTNLYLQDNNIQVIPDRIDYLINLVALDLSQNYIEKFSLSIAALTELDALRLSGNMIRKVPQSISRLVKLEELDLANNSIDFISRGITKLINLEELDLSNNIIKRFDMKLLDLPNLKKLDLSLNWIEKLPDDDRIVNKKQRRFW